jgi:hypothetical protein
MRKKLKLDRKTIQTLTPLPDSRLDQVNGGVANSWKADGGAYCSTILTHCCTNAGTCTC